MKDWRDFGIDVKGRVSGDVRTTCPQCSPHRKKRTYPCLHADLDQGLWCCHHCGWGGTLKSGQFERPIIDKVYKKPSLSITVPKSEIVQWFEKRGISEETVVRHAITQTVIYFPQTEEEMPCIAFPYYRGGDVVNVKYRTSGKLFRMAAGAERILYGIDDIGEELVWVEGEMDKLSVFEAGFASCVSVPDGAPTPETKNYSSKFDFLAEPKLGGVRRHIIAVDNDAPGVRLSEELIRRLGAEKCSVVIWPSGCKDANDVLKAHGKEFLAGCIRSAKPVPIEDTFTAQDVAGDVINDWRHGATRGLSTGWEWMDPYYRVMPGEWTLVTGIPGHGKSEWLDGLMVNLAHLYGWSFAVFSPENQPLAYHVEKIAEKHTGKPFNSGLTPRMGEDEVSAALDWINGHFFFILPELPTVETLLETAAKLVLRHGIRGLVIDPWNEIDHSRLGGMTETEHISQSLSKIRSFARRHKVHVWVVAHPTKLLKGADEKYPVPTPYDVAGSAHWRNKADNCLSVYRAINTGNGFADEVTDVHVQKVRKKANGEVGIVSFSYVRSCGQFVAVKKPSLLPTHFASKHKEYLS